MSITNHKSCQDAPFSTGWFKPEVIFNQVLDTASVGGRCVYQAIRKRTHDTADFNVCIFRSSQLSVGISVSAEKRTDIIFAGELHRGRGGKKLAGLLWHGAPPSPTGEGLSLQEAWAWPPGVREALGLGQRGPHHCKHTRY